MQGVSSGYGRVTVLRDLSLTIARGEVVALLGPNGAGKTTLLRTAAGLNRAASGEIRLGGLDVTRANATRRSQAGLVLIPEGRGIFPNLTVRENLVIQHRRHDGKAGIERVLEAFPALKPLLRRRAGSMSGGQQQMVALGRAFVRDLKVVLLDEVSMGLAPLIIDEIFAALRRLADTGISLVLVEQYVSRALAMSDRVYLLDRGAITDAGSPAGLDEEELMRRYLSQGELEDGGEESLIPGAATS